MSEALLAAVRAAGRAALESALQALAGGANSAEAAAAVSAGELEVEVRVSVAVRRGRALPPGAVRVYSHVSPYALEDAAARMAAREFVSYVTRYVFPAGAWSEFRRRLAGMARRGAGPREILEEVARWLCSLLREGRAAPADRRSAAALRTWEEYCGGRAARRAAHASHAFASHGGPALSSTVKTRSESSR